MMPNADDYSKFPKHPLCGVPQEILDAGRKATKGAVERKDLRADMAHPLADAVIAEVIAAGFVITTEESIDARIEHATYETMAGDDL